MDADYEPEKANLIILKKRLVPQPFGLNISSEPIIAGHGLSHIGIDDITACDWLDFPSMETIMIKVET